MAVICSNGAVDHPNVASCPFTHVGIVRDNHQCDAGAVQPFKQRDDVVAGVAAVFTGVATGLLGGFYDPVAMGAGGASALFFLFFWFRTQLGS